MIVVSELTEDLFNDLVKLLHQNTHSNLIQMKSINNPTDIWNDS